MKQEMRALGRYTFNDSRPVRDQVGRLTPGLRREYQAFPSGRTQRPVEYQLYRARRLAAGATEEDVLGELRRRHPLWHDSLERGWGDHLPGLLRGE